MTPGCDLAQAWLRCARRGTDCGEGGLSLWKACWGTGGEELVEEVEADQAKVACCLFEQEWRLGVGEEGDRAWGIEDTRSRLTNPWDFSSVEKELSSWEVRGPGTQGEMSRRHVRGVRRCWRGCCRLAVMSAAQVSSREQADSRDGDTQKVWFLPTRRKVANRKEKSR